jgi:uncharacterized protein
LVITTPVAVAAGTRSSTTRTEWPLNLDLDALRSSGWRPTPFRQYVLKLHSRCNLRCAYCYVYEQADQTWRDRPQRMSLATVEATAQRISEHVRRHSLSRVEVVFHGGEPLLVGPVHLEDAIKTLKAEVEPLARLDLSVQSNGVLLTDDVLDVAARHQVRIGVSLDGRASDHDRYRRHASGAGSHAEVIEALGRLRRTPYKDLFAGLLCTVDLDNDPLATYDALLELSPPMIDFLLPHGNWSSPPPTRRSERNLTPYADWLLAIFDRWYSAPRTTGIRIFDEMISLALGGPSRSEVIGLSPVGLVVVETDGSLEQVDVLKSAYHGAAATGLNVFDHPLDRALAHPAIAARQIGVDGLAEDCQRCPQVLVCGGGYYPHRYRAGEGYKNPSVYCPDLLRLTHHITARVRGDLRALRAADEVPSTAG